MGVIQAITAFLVVGISVFAVLLGIMLMIWFLGVLLSLPQEIARGIRDKSRRTR